MVKGITLQELSTQLVAMNTAKRDYVINTRGLKVTPAGQHNVTLDVAARV